MIYNGILWNDILDTVFLAWFLAQAYKGIYYVITEKKINFKRFLETGGMPSSHTSTVVSLFVAVSLREGFNSTYSAIAFIFAIIVMYDATGVRRAAGKQAVVLNKLMDNIWKKEGSRIIEENLKELLGHSPIEVLGGAILGVVIALIMHSLRTGLIFG